MPELPSSKTTKAAVNERMIDKIKRHHVALTSNVDGRVVPFNPDEEEDIDSEIGNHLYYSYYFFKHSSS